MIKWILLFLIPMGFVHSDHNTRKDALDLGRKEAKKAFESISLFNSDTILPEEDKGKTFNADVARKKTEKGESVNSQFDFLESRESQANANNTHLSPGERIFKDEQFDVDAESAYIETCYESADPVEFSILREIILTNERTPAKTVEFGRCQGHIHEYKVKRGSAEDEVRRIKRRLSKDKTLRTFSVTCEDRGIGHRDKIIIQKYHINDLKTCTNMKIVSRNEPSKIVTVENGWKYSNLKLLEISQSPDCSLISKKCLDDEPRMINGKECKRCFVEELKYFWQPHKKSSCNFLKSELCDLKSSQCILDGPFGCALWQRTYQCYRKLKKKKVEKVDINVDTQIYESEYVPNRNFGDVVTKLSLFKEMDNELKNSPNIDIQGFQFFSGQSKRCFVHEMKSIGYDCCNRMGGLSNDIFLSKCDAEEVALADLKDRGQCHYLGWTYEKHLGAKTSKKHVYCCFPSKLARVFQEKAKEQLGISWGSPEIPNCHGLKRNDIQRVDMSQIDLSEAFENSKKDISHRLERVTQKLQGSFAG